MDEFRNSPPVTRTLAASVFVLSMLIVCGVLDTYRVVFLPGKVFKVWPEFWRPFSSFLYTGGLGIIWVPYSIWNFGGSLERDVARYSSANFIVYLLFVGSIIIGLNNYIFGGFVFTSELVLAIAWSYAQNNRGKIVNFFFINIPVMYLPWAMLFLTLIQAGPGAALSESVAIPAAHLYEFLTDYWPTYGGGRNFLPAPRFLVNYFGGTPNVKEFRADSGLRSNRVPGTEPGSAFLSGNSWGQRGAGRRLG